MMLLFCHKIFYLFLGIENKTETMKEEIEMLVEEIKKLLRLKQRIIANNLQSEYMVSWFMSIQDSTLYFETLVKIS